MSYKQADFNSWLLSVLQDLKGQYINLDVCITLNVLEKRHFAELRTIFKRCIESSSPGAKEAMQAYQDSFDEAKRVLLRANNLSVSKLEWDLQMDHYMNSGKYD